jgi:hypothetical protein
MRPSTRWIVLAAALVQACGGGDLLQEERDASNLDTQLGPACADSEIDWPASSTTDQCSGPWEYQSACCITSHVGTSCRHAHAVGTYTSENFASGGTYTCTHKTCEYLCYAPAGKEVVGGKAGVTCPRTCTCDAGYWTYPSCDTLKNISGAYYKDIVKQRVVDTYQFGTTTQCKIDPATGIAGLPTDITAAAVRGGGGTASYCYYLVFNAPNGQQNVCNSESDLAMCGPDLAQPIYGACVPGRTTNPAPDGTPHQEVDPIAKAACTSLAKGYSGRNLSKQQLIDGNPMVVSAYRYLDSTCLSCENVGGLQDMASVQAKFQCLRGQIELPKAGAPAYDDVAIDHLKRLFEAYGHWLTQAQVDFAVTQYENRPDVQPACGTSWDAPAEAAPSSTLNLLRNDLQMCNRLVQPHAASQADPATRNGPLPRLDWLVTPKCVGTIAQTKNAAAGNPNLQTYLDKAIALSVAVSKTGFRYIGNDALLEPRSAVLARNLQQLGSWYTSAKAGAYGGPDASSNLGRDTSALAGGIWDGLYTADLAALRGRASDGSLQDLELTDHLNLELRKDIELLGALFPSAGQPPLTGAPALYLVADGLEMLSERLGHYAPYHDLGCKFLGCRTRKTEVSALNDLLGKIADRAALYGSVGDASYVAGRASTWNEWRSIFARIADPTLHASVFQQAVLDALPPGYFGANPPQYTTDLVLAPPDGSAQPLQTISSFVTAAAGRTTNYGQTGLFLDGSDDALSHTLRFEDWPDVKARVNDAVQGLEDEIGRYDAGRAGLAVDLLDEIELQQTQTSLDLRLQNLAADVQRLGRTMAELRLGGSIDAALFSQEALKFEQKMRALQDAGTPLYPVNDRWLDPISGQAVYSGNGSFANLSEVAVRDAAGALVHVSGGRGDVLNFAVSGKYSPTCAMRSLGGRFAGVNLTGVEGALTGPEGFELVYSSGSFQAHSFSETTQHRWSLSVEACGGLSTPPVTEAIGFTAHVQVCAGYDYSYSRTTEDKNGWEDRSSAGFSKGLRLPNTPFPNYPVGSLLAVAVAKDQQPTRSAIRSVQVVQPQGSIVLTEDVDVYLVVNDKACGDASGALNMRVTTLSRPLSGSAARNLAEAMSAVVVDLGAQWTTIISAGRILPDQMAGIRLRAWEALRSSVEQGWQFSSYYPEIVTGFFDAWLGYEIVKTERAVDLVGLNEDYRAKIMEMRVLDADLDAVDRRGRLHALFPVWTLANLDGNQLGAQTDYVALVATQQLHPFVRIRYPEALDGANLTSLAALVDGTSTNNWSSPLDDVGTLVRNAVNSVMNYADYADSQANKTFTQVVVRFPNPDVVRTFQPTYTDGHTADPLRSKTVWDAIKGNRAVQVEIRPEDIYGQGNAEASLSCWAAAPVVGAMALYFESAGCSASGDQTGCIDVNWNTLDKRAETFVASPMRFTTRSGVDSRRFVDRAWLNSQKNKALWGAEGYAVDYFLSARAANPVVYSQGVKGISPFTTFDFSPMVGTLYPPASGASPYALVLVLELQAVQKATSMPGIGTCP